MSLCSHLLYCERSESGEERWKIYKNLKRSLPPPHAIYVELMLSQLRCWSAYSKTPRSWKKCWSFQPVFCFSVDHWRSLELVTNLPDMETSHEIEAEASLSLWRPNRQSICSDVDCVRFERVLRFMPHVVVVVSLHSFLPWGKVVRDETAVKCVLSRQQRQEFSYAHSVRSLWNIRVDIEWGNIKICEGSWAHLLYISTTLK